jgi:general secretion pathway protein E/type IV pilus assembly protein PilB
MSSERNIALKAEQQQLISADQAWHYRVIPEHATEELICFLIDTAHYSEGVKEELEMLFGKQVELKEEAPETIQQALSKYYRKKNTNKTSSRISYTPGQEEDFVVRLIAEANDIGCSDIHIESYEERSRIRFRIDGKLIEKYVIAKEEYPALINKLKIRANLDIAEKRLPQDGRISFEEGGSKFDIRVSVLPTLYGEKVVMRLLSKDATEIVIEKLGFSDRQLEDFLEAVKKTHGIVLISGPTGSGKTTTLYATLKELNNEKTNIVTIEDPIEYTLPGINQVQLRENIGLSFSGALRSFLRQDPDVIMLGEIRDGETAKMAIRAALTGHLVLSTIHTNSAWGTVSRLVDMGVPPYLLASTLNVTAAQRLVRLLCENCKTPVGRANKRFPPQFSMPYELNEVYEAVGCDACHYTGYAGRRALYEIIPINNLLAEKVKSAEFNVNEILEQMKVERLDRKAFDLLAAGETSLEEVYYFLMLND